MKNHYVNVLEDRRQRVAVFSDVSLKFTHSRREKQKKVLVGRLFTVSGQEAAGNGFFCLLYPDHHC